MKEKPPYKGTWQEGQAPDWVSRDLNQELQSVVVRLGNSNNAVVSQQFLILDIKLISVIIFAVLLWDFGVFCVNKKGGRKASNGIRVMPEQKRSQIFKMTKVERFISVALSQFPLIPFRWTIYVSKRRYGPCLNFWSLNFDPRSIFCWQSHYRPGGDTAQRALFMEREPGAN